MQVIGLCRFSYPAIGGFQVEHASTAEREAYLYDPERMDQRFRSFEQFTLPCLRAQSDPDFTLLIVIGESLPAAYRARLEQRVRDLPQAVIRAYPPRRHRDVMKEAINDLRGPGMCLQFRLDDDDAVGVRFVERLRRSAGLASGLLEDHHHVAIDFVRGHIACPLPDGIATAPVIKPFWTPGLGMLVRGETRSTIMNFAHQSIGRHMPTLRLADEDMMLRGYGEGNDSRQKPGIRPVGLSLLDAGGEAQFRETYNIDAEAVRRSFA